MEMRGRKGHKMDRGGRAHRPRQGRETQTHKCLIFTEEKKQNIQCPLLKTHPSQAKPSVKRGKKTEHRQNDYLISNYSYLYLIYMSEDPQYFGKT